MSTSRCNSCVAHCDLLLAYFEPPCCPPFDFMPLVVISCYTATGLLCCTALLSSKQSEQCVAWLQFGVYMAYALVAYCYFGVAFTGYHAFGSGTGDQILYSLGHPVWVVCVASVMVIVHVCGSFQVSWQSSLWSPASSAAAAAAAAAACYGP